MVKAASAEFRIVKFSTELLQVVYEKRPQMQNIVARELLPLLYKYDICTAKKAAFNSTS